MNRSIDPVPARSVRNLLAFALAAVLLAGCGGGRATKPKPPAPEPSEPTTPIVVPDKGDPQGRFTAALQLMKQKKTAEAEKAFLDLTKDFPEYSGPQTNLGIIFATTNRRDGAIAAFTRAANANPSNASAFNWLGILNREVGDYARARQAYEKALQIKPGYAAAELNLGILLEVYMKQPAEALPHYRNYQQITGGTDLRVLPWIAEIEANQPKAPASPAETEVK